MSCGVGRRRGSDPVLPWLWWRPAATAPIRPLGWEPPHAAGAALEKAKKKKKKVISGNYKLNATKIIYCTLIMSEKYFTLKLFLKIISLTIMDIITQACLPLNMIIWCLAGNKQ